MKRYIAITGAVLLAAGLTACSNETRDDAAITAGVRQELVDEKVPGMIEVATTYGVVTLSGNVPDADAKAKAEDAAEDVDGVDRVVNNLRTTTAADAPMRQDPAVPPVDPNAPSAPAIR